MNERFWAGRQSVYASEGDSEIRVYGTVLSAKSAAEFCWAAMFRVIYVKTKKKRCKRGKAAFPFNRSRVSKSKEADVANERDAVIEMSTKVSLSKQCVVPGLEYGNVSV